MLICIPFSFYADTWNGEGTGGQVGSATTNTYVIDTEEYSGIRVTIVDDTGSRVAGTHSVDYMQKVAGNFDTYHFSGKKSKIEYRAFNNVNKLSLVSGDYQYTSSSSFANELGPELKMPIIVLKSGSNLYKIREWLTTKSTRAIPDKIARDCGLWKTAASSVNPDTVNLYRNTLCANNYHILVEPVGSVVVQGVPYTGTATELAFLAQKSGCAWNYLSSYIDMQLPLSMYLSFTQLGIPARPGGFTASKQSREDIITYLGCAITSYRKDGTDITDDPYDPGDDPQPVIPTPPVRYDYSYDTDVYSSVKITNETQTGIVDTGWVSFEITGPGIHLERRMEMISLPPYGEQLAYCRWHTPAAPGPFTITVTASEGIKLSTDTITCYTHPDSGQDPPDPKVTDKRNGWTYTAVGNDISSMGATWGHWEYTVASANDREIDAYYYHEHGSQSKYYHTGHHMESSVRINDSPYYRLISEDHVPAEYEYGAWESHRDEPLPVFNTENTDLRYAPYNSKTVVRYLASEPYHYEVVRSVRSRLSWYNSPSTSGFSLQDRNNGTRYYTVNNGNITYSEPTPTAQGQVLRIYDLQGTVTAGTQTMYRYKVTTRTAAFGAWNIMSFSDIFLSEDQGTSFVRYNGNTEKYEYTLKEILYTELVYTGDPSTPASSLAADDAHLWIGRHATVTDYYTWEQRSKKLIKEASDKYVYDMYDTVWTDSGSYWSVGKQQINTQKRSWKWISESVSVITSAVIRPDSRCPSAYELNGVTHMKSGYGIEIEFTVDMRTLGRNKNGEVSATAIQGMKVLFPEFGWRTYRRLLERTGTGQNGDVIYGFMMNKYSRLGARSHFTPIWYPNGQIYKVRVNISSVWTPAGEISFCSPSNEIIISDGTCYDDWAIGLTP